MEKINNVRKLTRASMLLVFALVIIFIGARFGGAMFNQVVVGPLVNAVIITAVLSTDTKFGILVALLTPVLAVLTGQFKAIPFIPFIMAGNIILAVACGLMERLVKKFGIYIGIVIGAVLKTLFLILSANYLVSLFGIMLPQAIIDAMSFPQLYTALAGGAVAVIFYGIFKRIYKGN